MIAHNLNSLFRIREEYSKSWVLSKSIVYNMSFLKGCCSIIHKLKFNEGKLWKDLCSLHHSKCWHNFSHFLFWNPFGNSTNPNLPHKNSMSFDTSLTLIIIDKPIREIRLHVRYVARWMLSFSEVVSRLKILSLISLNSSISVFEPTFVLLIVCSDIYPPSCVIERYLSNYLVDKILLSLNLHKCKDVSWKLTISIPSYYSKSKRNHLISITSVKGWNCSLMSCSVMSTGRFPR